MDGGMTSYDTPPAVSGSTPPPGTNGAASSEPPRDLVASPHVPQFESARPGEHMSRSTTDNGSLLAVSDVEDPPAPPPLAGQVHPPAPEVIVEPLAVVESVADSPSDLWDSGVRDSSLTQQMSLHDAEDVGTADPQGSVATLSRSSKVAYLAVFTVLALSALGLLYVHVLRPGDHPSKTAIRPTTTTTSAPATTTTVAIPSALGASAEAAANALVSDWSSGNKTAALTVATPTSVATLFAAPYSSGLAISRGCSTTFSPIVCTFGPPGGAAPTDAIYQILVSQAASGGWYVSTVRVQN